MVRHPRLCTLHRLQHACFHQGNAPLLRKQRNNPTQRHQQQGNKKILQSIKIQAQQKKARRVK